MGFWFRAFLSLRAHRSFLQICIDSVVLTDLQTVGFADSKIDGGFGTGRGFANWQIRG